MTPFLLVLATMPHTTNLYIAIFQLLGILIGIGIAYGWTLSKQPLIERPKTPTTIPIPKKIPVEEIPFQLKVILRRQYGKPLSVAFTKKLDLPYMNKLASSGISGANVVATALEKYENIWLVEEEPRP